MMHVTKEVSPSESRPPTTSFLVSPAQPKLFNLFSCKGIYVSDISLKDYVAVTGVNYKYLPDAAGGYIRTSSGKAQCPIVEQLVSTLMSMGRNNEKKCAVRIVKRAFIMVNVLTNKNPLQVLLDAAINSAPIEPEPRPQICRLGIAKRQAVEVSPIQLVNKGIRLLCAGARKAALRNINTIPECLADELMDASRGSYNSYAINQKDFIEKVAELRQIK